MLKSHFSKNYLIVNSIEMPQCTNRVHLNTMYSKSNYNLLALTVEKHSLLNYERMLKFLRYSKVFLFPYGNFKKF